MKIRSTLLTTASVLAVFLSGCSTTQNTQPSTPAKPKPTIAPSPIPSSAPVAPRYAERTWQEVPAWNQDQLVNGWQAWLKGCAKPRTVWSKICADAKSVPVQSAAIRQFIETRLTPYQLINPDGNETGLITGYYEPVYPGSLTRTATANQPVYAPPKDMITVALDEVYPELKGKRLRGRIVGNKLVPYPDRAEIVAKGLDAPVLAWLTDPMNVQFLQIQGSGRVQLPNGQQLRLGYADQNGRPYKPVGRWLVEQGLMPASEVSMQSINAWAKANPKRIDELLNSNPSYVFFRTLPPSNDGRTGSNGADGPIGSLNVPLTAGYSIAVDPNTVPLGSLAFIATTRPDNDGGIHRMVAAQDTGGAIRGTVRADFFWGTGDAAGELAGKMKQDGKLWLLWPKGTALPN
ncbi:MltA domain-containing protein [Chitinibacter bivalviorum]|uniref:peptidoglycan lytic exotransglycosylase n=1 Tax=Chitinibacter bivalviorum TaxID=2739434 RepID=A0A7H9BFN1_9NEIS|nr:MltA domain-containing protein [Chitinibacter bivalviorum]QLG87385.1 MltA domain-containing protein [Chitinibacter bivalviorum]